MTIEEAIEKYTLLWAKFPEPVLTAEEIQKVLDAVGDLVNKAKPQRITQRRSKWTQQMYDVCPACGDRLNTDGITHNNFCSFCGQALDWGDADE